VVDVKFGHRSIKEEEEQEHEQEQEEEPEEEEPEQPEQEQEQERQEPEPEQEGKNGACRFLARTIPEPPLPTSTPPRSVGPVPPKKFGSCEISMYSNSRGRNAPEPAAETQNGSFCLNFSLCVCPEPVLAK
jgi:hypothetical protein